MPAPDVNAHRLPAAAPISRPLAVVASALALAVYSYSVSRAPIRSGRATAKGPSMSRGCPARDRQPPGTARQQPERAPAAGRRRRSGSSHRTHHGLRPGPLSAHWAHGNALPRPRSGSPPIGQRPDWVGLGEAAGPQREVSGRSRHGGRWLLGAGGDLIEGVRDAQPPGAHPADIVRGCTQGESWLSRHAPAGPARSSSRSAADRGRS